MKQSSPVDIVGVYADYTKELQEENRNKRYKGKEHYYHASGAGSCSRKLYFESVLKAEPSNPIDEKSLRLLRLGTLVHNDFEKALLKYNTKVYSKVDSNIGNNTKDNIVFHTEGEIIIDDLNVRGFYDIVVDDDRGVEPKIYLYDLKTCAAYSWKVKFGRNKTLDTSNHYELQLGTYGYAIREKFGRLDGMFLYYYNKDNSQMRPVSVPLMYVEQAYTYWKNVNEEHKKGLPEFRLGISPVQKWQCNYCQFKDHCNPPQ